MHFDFFTYLLAFLGMGLVCVFISSRLGLGPILGYLVAGILIGPFALGIIKNTEVLHEVSELYRMRWRLRRLKATETNPN